MDGLTSCTAVCVTVFSIVSNECIHTIHADVSFWCVVGNEVADVGGDDLLPALVLVLTRLNPSLVSSIRYQTCMLDDLMPEFLTRGCHAFALAEFQIAFQVIEGLL